MAFSLGMQLHVPHWMELRLRAVEMRAIGQTIKPQIRSITLIRVFPLLFPVLASHGTAAILIDKWQRIDNSDLLCWRPSCQCHGHNYLVRTDQKKRQKWTRQLFSGAKTGTCMVVCPTVWILVLESWAAACGLCHFVCNYLTTQWHSSMPTWASWWCVLSCFTALECSVRLPRRVRMLLPIVDHWYSFDRHVW